MTTYSLTDLVVLIILTAVGLGVFFRVWPRPLKPRCRKRVSLAYVDGWHRGPLVVVSSEPPDVRCALPAGHSPQAHLVDPEEVRALRLYQPPF